MEMTSGPQDLRTSGPPKKVLRSSGLAVLILMLGFALQAQAAPQALYIQGRLTDAAGNPVFGGRTITVKIKHPSALDYSRTLVVYPNDMGFFEAVIEGGSFPNFDLQTFFDTKYSLEITALSETKRQDVCSAPYALEARRLQGFEPATHGTYEHIVKTTSSGEAAFGEATITSGTAVTAKARDCGVFLRGGTYGAISDHGARGVAGSQKAEGVRAYGKTSLEIGRGKIITTPLLISYMPLRIDHKIAGTDQIGPGAHNVMVYNNFIYDNSIVLLTIRRAGSVNGEKVWLGSMGVESGTRRPYFVIERSTTEGTSYVNWFILN